jgi:hypothetical protein
MEKVTDFIFSGFSNPFLLTGPPIGPKWVAGLGGAQNNPGGANMYQNFLKVILEIHFSEF